MTGYPTEAYAQALAEWGRPRPLVRSGGYVLDRAIPGRDDRDSMGPYPLFGCRDWAGLADDLLGLDGLVSLVLVADPLGDFDPGLLDRTFNRGAIAFKRHHVVELDRPPDRIASPHHRRNARKALGRVEVERSETPDRSWLDDWLRLYPILIDRHSIRGISAFSRASFTAQWEVPGLVAFRACSGGATVGMNLWFVQGEVAYYHLGAYDEAGYRLNASFGLFDRAIDWFARSTGVRRLDLGAGAGTGDPTGGGLDRFKSGWATTTRTAYLCRHVFQADRYDAHVRRLGLEGSGYFPAYRSGEFGPDRDRASVA